MCYVNIPLFCLGFALIFHYVTWLTVKQRTDLIDRSCVDLFILSHFVDNRRMDAVLPQPICRSVASCLYQGKQLVK